MTEASALARLVLAGSFLFSAVLCSALGIPLVRGRVPMNRWYGVRIRRTLVSESHWYALNRFGGRQLLGYAVGLGLAGATLLAVPLSPARWYFWPLLLSPLWLLIPVLWRILAYAKSLR